MGPHFDRSIVDRHEQRFQRSCIPSCVELVLKLLKKVDLDYYVEQDAWQDRKDGSFGNYNNRELCGIRFRHLFHEHSRGPTFPLDDLFSRIASELDSGRFVVISLKSDGGWHMYVVHSCANGEFHAISKFSPPKGAVTIEENQVRAVVSRMEGTDILVYEDMT